MSDTASLVPTRAVVKFVDDVLLTGDWRRVKLIMTSSGCGDSSVQAHRQVHSKHIDQLLLVDAKDFAPFQDPAITIS